jgi:hypothetical protein
MFNFDPLEPLFIVGDLNMDLLSSAGDELKDLRKRFTNDFFNKLKRDN